MNVKIEDFKTLDIRIGTVKSAEPIEGADKLLRLEVDIGGEVRQIVAGLAQFYKPDELVGKQVPILANLEYRKFRGVESQGMLLAADGQGEPVLLVPVKNIPDGGIVR